VDRYTEGILVRGEAGRAVFGCEEQDKRRLVLQALMLFMAQVPCYWTPS